MTRDRELVLATLGAFTASWKALDGEAIAACFEEATTVIGTDPGEYITGSEAYREGWRRGGYPASAAAFDWEREPIITVEGAAAWAHGVVIYDLGLADGSAVSGRMWITAALRRSDAWRIAHLHASYADIPTVSPAPR